jgi:hypothetical protein
VFALKKKSDTFLTDLVCIIYSCINTFIDVCMYVWLWGYVYPCMYVCILTFVDICIIYGFKYVWLDFCICMYSMYLGTYVWMDVYRYIYIYLYMKVRLNVCFYSYVFVYMFVFMHEFIYIAKCLRKIRLHWRISSAVYRLQETLYFSRRVSCIRFFLILVYLGNL